jgi:GIY-YIG catalytic domain-containing protein
MSIGPGQPTNAFDVVGVALAPSVAGVYAICRADGSYVYFGHAENIRQRLTAHLIDGNSCIHREGGVAFSYELCDAPVLRVARQHQLLATYPTRCNLAVSVV